MKLAIISDIHGNLQAFNMVLKYINEEKIDKILNLGDFVRGDNEEEIIRLIKNDNRFISIVGNHEVEYCKELDSGIGKSDIDDINWIKKLQETNTVEIDNVKILMVHSRISSCKAAPLLYRGSKFDDFMDDYPNGFDLICFGHTHIQVYIENFYGKKLLNPGSVGIGLDGNVNFAVIEVENDNIIYKFIKLKI